MKYTILFALLAVFSIGIASCSNETTTNDMSQLPAKVQTSIKDNFKANVLSATTEKNTFGDDEYEVVLSDGSKVKYEGDEWEEVSVPTGGTVPESFISAPIREYLAANQPTATVVKIERDKKGYEVTLSNGLELKFDLAGKFVKLD